MSTNSPVKIENFGNDAVCESCGNHNATRIMFSKDSTGGIVAELCPVCLSAVLAGLDDSTSSDNSDDEGWIIPPLM